MEYDSVIKKLEDSIEQLGNLSTSLASDDTLKVSSGSMDLLKEKCSKVKTDLSSFKSTSESNITEMKSIENFFKNI